MSELTIFHCYYGCYYRHGLTMSISSVYALWQHDALHLGISVADAPSARVKCVFKVRKPADGD